MKILIVLKDLYMGGIQRSAVNMANFLVRSGQQVDLFIFNKRGPLSQEIDSKVNIIAGGKALLPFSVSQGDAKSYGNIFWIKRTTIALWCKFLGNKLPLKMALKKQKEIAVEYDVVIASSGSVGTKSMTVGVAEFVLTKTKSKQKWCLVHGDYSKSGLNEPYSNSLYEKFDKVLCVSESCSKVMQKLAPKNIKNIGFLYNFCNDNDIILKSNEYKVELKKNFNIVSVSRLSAEKGHLRFLKVLKKLNNEGYIFDYTIVGDGPEKQSIVNFVSQNEMGSYVQMVGNKTNPYPYMKAADLFVLPSYHEAAPMVFAESFLCGTPVLTTNTLSANELVGDNGFIAENTEEGIYNTLREVLENIVIVENKTKQLIGYTYDNEAIRKRIKSLME